jgi:ABC-2 type transport system permease protein/oleandomycin transport system permease protein
MPGWLQTFADHQPVTAVANAMRGLVLGPDTLSPGQSVTGQTLTAIAWTAAILALIVPLAIRTYRRTTGS